MLLGSTAFFFWIVKYSKPFQSSSQKFSLLTAHFGVARTVSSGLMYTLTIPVFIYNKKVGDLDSIHWSKGQTVT